MADGRAVVRVVIDGHPSDVIVDTGLDAGVSLPDALRQHLNVVALLPASSQMADGTIVRMPLFEIEVEIDGAVFRTDVVFVNSPEILLGVKALANYRLTIDYPAGTVTLERARP